MQNNTININVATGDISHSYTEPIEVNEVITIDYDAEVVNRIRLLYDINRELKVQRERDSKTEQFNEYYNYVEQCKQEVREMYNV